MFTVLGIIIDKMFDEKHFYNDKPLDNTFLDTVYHWYDFIFVGVIKHLICN